MWKDEKFEKSEYKEVKTRNYLRYKLFSLDLVSYDQVSFGFVSLGQVSLGYVRLHQVW